MQFLHILLVATSAFLQSPSIAGRFRPFDFVLVRQVVDGDTIVVSNVGRVRLLGIRAPAIGRRPTATGAPFAREARDRLTALLMNRWVRLEADGASISRGRLAYVMTGDGTCVNATMVREGLARVDARLPLVRLPELQRAEAEARVLRRGIWSSTPRSPSTGYTGRLKASRPPTSRTTAAPSHRRRPTQK
jgi:endonuclease YncB( thermonuclease family)